MNIERITVHQFDIPLEEPFITDLRPVPELKRVLVEIETDDGLVGIGEGAPGPMVTGETQVSVADAVVTYVAPRLIGEDPRDFERLRAIIEKSLGKAPTTKAAVEMAIQDLRGKLAELPLYQLLGGAAKEPVIEAPAVLSLKSPDEMAEDASEAVDAGYTQFKIKLGDDPEIDVERVRTVRDAVPRSVSLKADANQGWRDAKTATKVLREVGDELDVIEQPVSADNEKDLARIRDAVSIPVMPDESLHTATDALRLVEQGAGDMYNIKLMKSGGLAEAARINAIAAADHRRTQVGSMVEGHVGTAAGVHFSLAFENVVWNEMVGPFMATDGITDLQTDEPEIRVEGPGLGVRVDSDRLEELTTDRLVVER